MAHTERSRPLARRALLGGAAALGLSRAARAFTEGDGARAARYALVTLLHTNDLHGRAYLPGRGDGLARLAPLVRRIRTEMPAVVLLDAGDIIHGTPEEKEFAGRPLLSAMNALGYDAATVGNHEFDFGQARLREAIDYARFPLLSANVVAERTGTPWGGLLPYTLIERDGARLGVFGLTTPTTVQIEWPRTLAGITFADPFEAARRMAAHLRGAERADAVIALSHLGYLPDRRLAETVPGIDVILGGHSHTKLAEQVWVNGTLIVQTGCYGAALGRVDLVVRKSGGTEPGRVVTVNGRGGRWWGRDGLTAPLGRTYPDGPLLPPAAAADAAVVAACRPFVAAMRDRMDETLTRAEESLPAADAVRRETAVGNLLADAVRARTAADVALAASGQIDPAGLAAGPVRVGDLYRLLAAYTRQHLVTVRVPGALLVETLRRLASLPDALPVHLSGAVVGPGDSVMIGDAPAASGRTYTVAAAAHVVQDYFYGRPGVAVLGDDVLAPTVRDAALAHLRGHAPLRAAVSPRWRAR